jgi:uncharacterized OB-fold protein
MRAPVHVPLPQPDAASVQFWAGCDEQRLLIPRCLDCGTFQSPPRLLCRNCRGRDFTWEQSAGLGLIYTYTVAHHPGTPALVDEVPYVVVVIELLDCGGARLVSNLIGKDDCVPAIGAPVRLIWDDVTGRWLPRFELVDS